MYVSVSFSRIRQNETQSTLMTFVADAGPPGPWDAFHVTDGRVVTGTNPTSAKETAEAVLEVFEKL
jgi:putative intracellular protease/amidase